MAALTDMVKNPNKKIIMDWTPKAACSVMVAMFFETMNIKQDVNYTGFVHRYRQDVFLPRYGHVTMEELQDPSWYKFKVVRNPYARMVSSYFHVMKTRLKGKFFKHNTTLQHNATFEQFVAIYRNEWWGKGHTFLSLDHVDAQSSDIEWKAYSNHDRIFNQIIRIEHFESDIQNVNHDTGLLYCSLKYAYTTSNNLALA